MKTPNSRNSTVFCHTIVPEIDFRLNKQHFVFLFKSLNFSTRVLLADESREYHIMITTRNINIK